MANIRLAKFEGRIPQVNAKVIPPEAAQTAKNCEFRRGQLRALNGLTKGDLMGGLLIVDAGGDITAYAKVDADNVTVTSAAHGLSNSDVVTISESTNYNGNYTVSNVTTNTFQITGTSLWVDDDAAGEWVRDYITVQEYTGDCAATALSEPSSGTVRMTAGAAHTVAVGDHIWFDSTMAGVAYYPSAYIVTSINDVGNSIDFTATYVENADPSDSDWFSGDLTTTGEVGAIYLMDDSWLNLAGDTDFAESFIADSDNRIYYTSASGLRQTNYTLAITGPSYTWPATYYTLGVEKPTTPLDITASTDSTALASTLTSITVDQSVAYVYTYVTSWDEEGKPSSPSEVIDITAGQLVTLAAATFSSPTVYNNNIDSVRIYKTVTGSNGTEYQWINKKGVITSISASGDAVFQSAGHTLLDGATVLVVGTTSHNGEYTVASATTNSFKLTDANGDTLQSAATDEGEWTQTSDITLADVIANGFIDRNDPEDAISVLTTDDYDVPPTDLQDIRLFANNVYAGFNGDNELCLSEPNYPYAWPIKHRIPVAHTIVAVGGFMSTLLVLTDTQPYMTIGTDPQSMTLYPMPYKKPCINNTGAVSTPHGVLYPTYDGLYQVTASAGKLVTKGIIDRETWEAYPLSDIYATYFDGKYIAFFKNTNQGFYLDFEAQNLRLVDLEFDVGVLFKNFHNSGEDLYILSNDNYLYQWNDNSTTKLTYTWKSKVFQQYPAKNFSVCRIIHDGDSAPTFNMYVDGSSTSFHTESPSADEPFRLPAGNRYREVEIEVTGTDSIDEIVVADSIEEIM